MRHFFLTLALFVVSATLFAQLDISGCTNPFAVNFNPNALEDNGSCENHPTLIELNATLDEAIVIGTGISNEHMAIANHGPVQMGLKINRRFISDIIPENGNDYFAWTGYSPTSFNDPTPVPGLARWDFIYSFNLGNYTFADLEAYLIIDFDPLDSPGQAAPFELNISEVLDDLNQDDLASRQGSENLGFAYWQGLAGPDANLFDPMNPGVYDLGLRLDNQGGFTLAEVSIRVIVEEAIEGCTDPAACNYDPLNNLEDNSCVYPEPLLNCDGTCANDTNNNGVCDENEVYGCIYPEALNYDPQSTSDDGSCIFESVCGSDCERFDADGNGIVQANDLLLFLTFYQIPCE